MANPILGTYTPCQIAIIVHDVEAAKRAYAAFWGQEVPPTQDAGTFDVTKTWYRGGPAPEAGCRMAFFELGNIQYEIIQPSEAPSTWREWLETRGEGLHHIAFQVEDIFKSMEDMKAAGYELTQWGYYGDASGAYAYFDCMKDLKCYVELLSSFK